MKKTAITFIFCVSFLFLLLGCTTDYDKLQEHFYSQRYLQALDTAIEGLDGSQKMRIHSFMSRHSQRIIDGAFNYGQYVYSQEDIPFAIDYLTALETTFNALRNAPFKQEKVDDYLTTIQGYISELNDSFITRYEDLGNRAFELGQYRKAVSLFDHIIARDPGRHDIKEKRNLAQKKAHIHVVVHPFLSRTQDIKDSVFSEILSIFNKERHIDSMLSHSSIIYGIVVSEVLQNTLVSNLNNSPGSFITALNDVSENNVDGFDVTGLLIAYEEDTELTPVRRLETGQLNYMYSHDLGDTWQTAFFEYPIYETSYAVVFNVTLHIKQGSTIIKTLQISHTHTETKTYRGQEVYWNSPMNVIDIEYPFEYTSMADFHIPIDRQFTVEEGIRVLSKKISSSLESYFFELF
jgi:tetratricopeptide (TPR) repeat protein